MTGRKKAAKKASDSKGGAATKKEGTQGEQYHRTAQNTLIDAEEKRNHFTRKKTERS